MLYNLDHAEDIDRCVRVFSTIRILQDMRVRVFSGGERLPDKGLQWAFSHACGTLRFWSQLDNVISRYFNSTLELDSATRCNMLAEYKITDPYLSYHFFQKYLKKLWPLMLLTSLKIIICYININLDFGKKTLYKPRHYYSSGKSIESTGHG